MKKQLINVACLYTISSFISVSAMQPQLLSQQDHLDQQLRDACLQVTEMSSVEGLLNQGANPLAKDANGNNCFHLLVQAAGNGERRNAERYVPLIKLLFNYNIPSEQQFRQDRALRDYLVNTELLEYVYPVDLISIIAQFANHYPSSQQNNHGQTPLHIILRSTIPSTNLANLFVKEGFICIDIKDSLGRLPDQSPRPSLTPAQIEHYEKTRTEIIEIITKTRNIE